MAKAKEGADSQDRAAALPSGGRLDSWKEIASYLKHSERTVRRWQDEGLPVHRHPHKRRAGVYAYKPELDAWWNDGHARLAEIERAQAARRWPWAMPGAAMTAALAVALFIGLAWRFEWFRPGLRAGQIRSLAVLPLTNLSGDPEQEYFADGMTDELITDLAQVSALRVISRTSVMHYK
jgi:hypothetical protein